MMCCGIKKQWLAKTDGETIENLELPLKRGCVITGRITDSNGEPMVETSVQLARVVAPDVNGPPLPPINNNAYRTDDRGIYRIFGLPAGKYKVSVGTSTREGNFGYQRVRRFIPETFHPDTTDESQAKIVELENGQEATDVDIKTGETKRAYEVSGRVVDAASGKPLAGLGLAFGTYGKEGRMNGSGAINARSEANGEFHIIGVRPGKHGVFTENRDGKSEPTPVEVIDGDVVGVEVRVQPGASISGTIVIEGTNDPAVLAKRSQINLGILPSPTTSFGGLRRAKVQADGSFRFGGLPPDKVRLTPINPLPGFMLLRVEQNGAPIKESTIEIHTGEQVSNVRAVFGYGTAAVRGQVKIIGGSLPEDVRLYVSLRRTDNASSNVSGALVDARGQFLVKGLVPGEYQLRIFPDYSIRSDEVTKILPKFSKVNQIVTAGSGSEVQATITIDLSPENNR